MHLSLLGRNYEMDAMIFFKAPIDLSEVLETNTGFNEKKASYLLYIN